jgi:exopolyphosphatase/guanosine-5'-triphosphate,3'-diphosphate pyrophosphatase
MPGVPIRILSGEEEARFSADGLFMGFPGADGVLGDLGGGSLELVRLGGGRVLRSASLPIGAIRLAERAGGDPVRARAVAEAELAKLPWLADGQGRDLYWWAARGGRWRACTSRRPATRSTSSTTTCCAGRRRATWPAW